MPAQRHRRRVNVRRRRIMAVVLALAVVTTLVLLRGHVGSIFTVSTSTVAPSTSTSTSTSTTTSTTVATIPHAPFAVGAVTFYVTEPATSSIGARTMPVTVRYPAYGSPGTARSGLEPLRSAGPYPLIIFSQGFDISPEAYAGLLNFWAAAGYVVADPSYPSTSPFSPGGAVRSDIVHHPHDLSFLISTLIADDSERTGDLEGLINTRRIGVIGQSDGGDVSLAAAANTCCHDSRISAAIILSGAELAAFPGTYFTAGSTPLLVVQGTDDLTMNPVTCSVTIYNAAPSPKYYLSMIGQTHLSAYVTPGPAQNVVTAVTTDFLNAYLRNTTSALSKLNSAGSVPGLATITSAAKVPAIAGTCPGAPEG